MARVVKPGGVVVAIDFVKHEREWMREELGVVWMGFAPDEIARWLEAPACATCASKCSPPSRAAPICPPPSSRAA